MQMRKLGDGGVGGKNMYWENKGGSICHFEFLIWSHEEAFEVRTFV